MSNPAYERSEAQKAASRENGKKSSGPVTDEGKNISRQNALKHGLTGAGVVLPADLEEEVQAEILLYQRDLKPQTDVENRLVQKAALASVRHLRLARAEVVKSQRRREHALEAWDAERSAHVQNLAHSLEPGMLDDPALALIQLRRTAAGCRLLADRWTDFAARVEDPKSLTPHDASRFMRLLGSFATKRAAVTAPHLLATWSDLDAVAAQAKGLPIPGDVAAIRERLREFIQTQRTELLERAEVLEEVLDAPDRAAAPDAALFDPSPEAARLQIYLNNADRTERQALALLRNLQRRHDQAARYSTLGQNDSLPLPQAAEVPSTRLPHAGEVGRGPREGAANPTASSSSPSRSTTPSLEKTNPRPTAQSSSSLLAPATPPSPDRTNRPQTPTSGPPDSPS